MNQTCPLCTTTSYLFSKNQIFHYYKCHCCYGIFADKRQRPDKEEEIRRYRQHNNDVEDKRYQQFVAPITSAIVKEYTSAHKGLDFGAGTGPVISKVLTDQGYDIGQYDPLFWNHPELLEDKYDYIALCEVAEHFHHPKEEFSLLRKLLKPNGKIYCMTELYDERSNFSDWYYINDNTHVFFYQEKTIHWIREAYGFSQAPIQGRLITFCD